MNKEVVAHIENLEHTYSSGHKALIDINLDIYKQEITAIIGQNGSGKTTLSKHFNGLLRPTAGKIFVNGKDVASRRVSEMAREVGYVFQNPNYQLFCPTVLEEIRFGLKNLKLSDEEIKARSREVIEEFDLRGMVKKQPVTLSSGSKKIVALASVYAMDPEILFLDEPTTGQDQYGKTKLGLLSRKMKQLGKTIIIISHDMDFVAEYADRVIVMNESRVILDGTPADVFSNEEVMKTAHIMPPQIYAIGNHIHAVSSETRLSVMELAKVLAEGDYCL
ncbi:MAG: ATP-binding cassette domain-containing protein [Erysipelotrichaceae bacterium]|nr:ATP-binding cassette domain-containing protein [Erysipelotrichaceae bacterium]